MREMGDNYSARTKNKDLKGSKTVRLSNKLMGIKYDTFQSSSCHKKVIENYLKDWVD